MVWLKSFFFPEDSQTSFVICHLNKEQTCIRMLRSVTALNSKEIWCTDIPTTKLPLEKNRKKWRVFKFLSSHTFGTGVSGCVRSLRLDPPEGTWILLHCKLVEWFCKIWDRRLYLCYLNLFSSKYCNNTYFCAMWIRKELRNCMSGLESCPETCKAGCKFGSSMTFDSSFSAVQELSFSWRKAVGANWKGQIS